MLALCLLSCPPILRCLCDVFALRCFALASLPLSFCIVFISRLLCLCFVCVLFCIAVCSCVLSCFALRSVCVDAASPFVVFAFHFGLQRVARLQFCFISAVSVFASGSVSLVARTEEIV